MEYRRFKEELKQRIEKELGEGTRTSFQDMERNNHTAYEGLEVGNGKDHVSAVLPLEELYKKYQESGSMEQTAGEALRMMAQRQEISADIVPKTWEEASGKLRAELVHYGWNRERLKDIPHRRFLDLAVTYRIEIPMTEGCVAGIRIDNRLMELLGSTEEKLYEAAMENLKGEGYHIQSMSELLGGMAGTALRLPEDAPEQYVLTNESCCYGAAGMLREDILWAFAEKTGRNFYILPSSVHELILVIDSPSIHAGCLQEMVKEVNESAVAREEWLSDCVYYYAREERTLMICNAKEKALS